MKYTAQKPQPPLPQNLLKPGEYRFRVNNALEKKSRENDNDMIELQLLVGTNPDDRSTATLVYDYLVFDGKSEWKVDGFLKSIGLHPGEGVETDVTPRKIINERGRVRIKVEKYDGRESNKVGAYLWEEEDDFSDTPPAEPAPAPSGGKPF